MAQGRWRLLRKKGKSPNKWLSLKDFIPLGIGICLKKSKKKKDRNNEFLGVEYRKKANIWKTNCR